MEIMTISDVLTPTYYVNLQNYFSSYKVDWHYKKHVHYVQEDHSNTSDSHGFMTMIYNNDLVVSPDFDKTVPVLYAIVDRMGCELKKILRIHACLTLNINKSHDNYPHTDFLLSDVGDNWYTAIYYLGESDGDTLFFDDDQKTIKYKQPFMENTAVVFSGEIQHSGTLPTNHRERVILNYNFEISDGS